MAFSTSFFALDSAASTSDENHQQLEQSSSIVHTTENGLPVNGQQPQQPQYQQLHRSAELMRSSPAISQPNPLQATSDGEMTKGINAATKSAAPKKGVKKGTATTTKAPSKRSRSGAGSSGTAKKGRSGTSSKKPKSGVAVTQTVGTADNAGDSSESDNGPYCLCRGPDDHRFMIACDRCEDWFHGECIGMDKHTGENLVQKYICPNCTDGGRYTTRFKKLCSFAGCQNPARIYDEARPSIFCSAEHCQAWWEQLISTLPKKRNPGDPDYLTQEEFMGLLDAQSVMKEEAGPHPNLPTSPWKLGKTPFEPPPNFWETPISAQALTPEEYAELTASAETRSRLSEQIALCRQMLQLIELAIARREAAIAAGIPGITKDICGYDTRLDTVGAAHQFSLFLQSPQGQSIFSTRSLDNPPYVTTTIKNPEDDTPAATSSNSAETAAGQDPRTAGMCLRKKCKPHNGWGALLTKTVRHDIRELALQIRELLEAEQRVRDGAAGRFMRRMKERNEVIAIEEDEDDDEHGNGFLREEKPGHKRSDGDRMDLD